MRLSGRAPYVLVSKRMVRVRGPRRLPWLAWFAAAAATIVLGFALAMPLWLPRTIRSLIPDRYIAAYAPKPIQDIVFAQVGREFLPTFSPRTKANSTTLLRDLSETGTPAPPQQQPLSLSVGTTQGVSATSTIIPPTQTPLPPLPAGFSLGESNFRDTPQRWNNCGPATLTMLLSYWAVQTTQEDVAAFVKPNPEDRNVRPDELAAYVESRGYKAVVRVNGTLDLLKRLIVNGYPVMIEKGFDVEDKGWMGHYVLLFAYSDTDKTFTSMDSYLGAGHVYTYDEVQKYWRQFNRTYLVVYRPEQAAQVAALIGPEVDDSVMYTDALNVAKQELAQDSNDVFAWFDLGSDLVALGDYNDAAAAFDTAYNTQRVPWRMLWYQFGPYEAYLHTGRYDDVRTLADRTLFDDVYSEEAYYYKALTYSSQGDTDNARRQLELALLYNKHYQAAQLALNKLTSQP